VASQRARRLPYNATQHGCTPEQHLWYFCEVISKENELWVAVDGDRVIGYLAINGDFVDQLFVAVGEQRRGVGTLRLRKATDFGRSPPPEDEPDIGYRWQPSRGAP